MGALLSIAAVPLVMGQTQGQKLPEQRSNELDKDYVERLGTFLYKQTLTQRRIEDERAQRARQFEPADTVKPPNNPPRFLFNNPDVDVSKARRVLPGTKEHFTLIDKLKADTQGNEKLDLSQREGLEQQLFFVYPDKTILGAYGSSQTGFNTTRYNIYSDINGDGKLDDSLVNEKTVSGYPTGSIHLRVSGHTHYAPKLVQFLAPVGSNGQIDMNDPETPAQVGSMSPARFQEPGKKLLYQKELSPLFRETRRSEQK